MKPRQLLQNFQTEEKVEETASTKPENESKKPAATNLPTKVAVEEASQPIQYGRKNDTMKTTLGKAQKAVEGGLKMGERRFTKQGSDGKFYAYGGYAPDAELDPRELAKAYDASKKTPKEQDRIEQLEREHIAESKKAQGREAPFRAAPKMKQGSPREIINSLGEEERIGGLSKADREKYYQRIFDKYDNDESFGGKERKYSKGGLSDVFHGESYGEEERKAMAPDYDESRFGEDSEKMFDEFAEYAKARGWQDEKADNERKPTPEEELENDEVWDADYERSYGPYNFSEWNDVELLKKAYKKAINAGMEDSAQNALERIEELGGDFDGKATQQRTVTQDDLENMADFADGYLGYDGWTIAKTPDGFFTNVTLGDPEEEPIEIDNETALKYFKELFRDAGLRKDYEDQFGKLPF